MIVCLMVNGLCIVSTQAGEEYSFNLRNNTDTLIKKILVSEDKETWGKFSIGSGVQAGTTVTLVWDESTNNQSCKQYVKAVFADGSESAPSKFDFCQSDLLLEF